MTFPLAKLGFLFLKQLSRPVANFIKNEAKQHPFFRKKFCLPPARAYHWVEMHSKLRKIRHKQVSYAPLTEEEEVELGANLLGEVVLFTMMSIILYFELARQGDKKAVRERMKEEEIQNLIETVSDTMNDVTELKESVKKIQKKLDSSVDDMLDLEEIKYELQSEKSQAHLHVMDYLQIALHKRRHYDYDDVEHFDPFSP